MALRPPADAVAHLRDVLPRWPSAPERWHVTLAFLGEVADPGPLGPLLQDACAGGPLDLRLAGSGHLRPQRSGVGRRGGRRRRAAALAGAVARAARAGGVDVEQRSYRPHLTVGRRGPPDPAVLAAYEGPSWTATEVELVRSHLGRTVEHEVLERCSLSR